jgi:capsular exopolysaccharide synthesis family protein
MPAPYPAPPDTGGALIRQHTVDRLRVLYKRRWTALAVFLVVFFAGAVHSLKTTPVYEASAQLLVERQPRVVTSLDSALQQEQRFENDFLPTELSILQSRTLARRTLAVLDVEGRAAAPAPPSPSALRQAASQAVAFGARLVGAPDRIEPPAPDETTALSRRIDAFADSLIVQPVRSTVMVTLRYRSPDPEYATRAVNALARQYIQQSIELRFTASKEANDWLGTQLDEQRQRVEDSEAALQRYLETNRAVAVDERQNITVQRLADLNAALTQARMQRIDREATYQQLNGSRQNRAALDAFPAILGNSFIQQLKTDVSELQRQHGLLAQRYGERHPEMIQATMQLGAAEAKLQSEIDKVVESVRSEFLAAQTRERSLVDALETQKREALDLNRQGIEYAVLQREAMSARQLYDSLLQRANESGVSGEFRGTNIQIVDEAEIPRVPVLPNTPRDLMAALLLGAVLALGLVFGLERLDNRIKLPEHVRQFGLPFLGLVPSVPQKKNSTETPLVNNGVPPSFAESIRSIRTAIVFSSPDEGSKTLVVTSTGPHEGKTLVASNLGLALAQAGQRTVILDGDLRRPRIHDVFDVGQDPGLSNVLVGDSTLSAALRPTTVPQLSVLPAGHLPPNPAELLGSERYTRLLAELKGRFDWILIDAPPVMAVTDAAVLAHSAGGVVFVIGAEMTSHQSARSALEQLTSAKARLAGVVLNRANVRRHAYYYAPYYRKEYADYHRAEPVSTRFQGR